MVAKHFNCLFGSATGFLNPPNPPDGKQLNNVLIAPAAVRAFTITGGGDGGGHTDSFVAEDKLK